MTDDHATLLDVSHLTVDFGSSSLWRRGRPVRAVNDVSFTLRPGETLGLVGESGSGKSTTARAIARLVTATAGSIALDGQDLLHAKGARLRRMRRDIQMVFQDPFSSLNPRRTVGASVSQPLLSHGLATRQDAPTKVAALLEQVGLAGGAAGRYPHEFSGGQRQRIGIARAMSTNPRVLICDEPVSALDVSIQAQVVNLLSDLQERTNVAMLFIAHDLSVVRHISHRVAVLYLGAIVEIGTVEQVYASPAHPYTMALLDSAPVPDPDHERARERITVRGEIPSAADPPPGCAFHTRCWLYERLDRPKTCRLDPPSVVGAAGHHATCHFTQEATHMRPSPPPVAATSRRRFGS